MVKTRSPKLLWDHCLELSTLIRSHTQETIMTGNTADINQICQFGWYNWVMFRDSVATFPDETMVLGHYLGPAPDVGSAHTVKILKSNGQVVHRLTLRLLTPDELGNSEHTALRQEFSASIASKLGASIKWDDFPSEELTPDPDIDDDDSLLGDDIMPSNTPDNIPTPEVGDNYILAQLAFPRGGKLAKGRVVSWKRDNDSNPIGRAHNNPILDTRTYN